MKTRDKLLAILKTRPGQWISGEDLCRELDISRAAVSKQMVMLKSKGYQILSATNKGYNLAGIQDKFIYEEIQDHLETSVFGRQEFIILNKTDSTNIQARKLAEQGSAEGSIVISEDQSQGRGRKDRQWFSMPEKSIMMSMILRPDLPPEKAPRLTLLAAVALAKTLIDLTDLDIKIKWPNDILVNGLKIAGISTGLSTDMDRVNYVILGLGLNVSTEQTDFPDELHAVASSILMETGTALSRVIIIKEFLYQFETIYNLMQTEGFEPVLRQWKKFAGIVGQPISVEQPDGPVSGTVQDIDSDGVLILQTSDNQIHRILSGDISLLDGLP